MNKYMTCPKKLTQTLSCLMYVTESATYSKMHARVLKQIAVVCCVIAALI